jgi:hypothetical protein
LSILLFSVNLYLKYNRTLKYLIAKINLYVLIRKMLFEVDDDTHNLDSVYKKEYYSKQLEKSCKTQLFAFKNRESNCILDPFQEYLNTQKKNEKLPPRLRTETIKEFLNKVRL